MASSNKHWPSMFKSKPCNSHHNQWKNDINSHSLMSSGGCYRIPNTSVADCEERTPEPKPRWNPKPEQIRILEAIFNSGMVNPPRDEIRKIRAQLQEYGQVGDANVFYWFQNRKSRSKNKRIHLQNCSKQQAAGHQNVITTETLPPSNTHIVDAAAAAPSSSSSSDKSSPRGPKRPFSLTSPTANSLLNMQSYFQAHTNSDLVVPAAAEPFLFPTPQAAGLGGEVGAAAAVGALGIGFSELSNVVQGQEQKHTVVGPWTANINSAILNYGAAKKQHQEQEKATRTMKIQPQPEPAEYITVSSPDPIAYNIGLAPPLPPSTIISTNNVTVPSTINQVQGAGQIWAPTISGGAAVRSTVFINDVAFEVGVGPLNVREAFGDDVVLIHSSGQPVLTNEWGVTLRPLQHGASYYLLPLNFHI